MTLDIPTLVIILLLTQALSALVLGLLWWRDRTIPGLGEWALARLLILLAILALGARVLLPLEASALLGQGLLMLSFHLAWLGSLAFMGRPRPRSPRPFLLFLLAYEGAFALLLHLDAPFYLRAALSALAASGYSLLIIRALWPMARDPDHLLGKLLLAGFLFTALFQLGRAGHLLLVQPDGTLLENSTHGRLLFLAAILSSLLTGFGCVGVTTERLNRRLRDLSERDPLTGLRNRRDFFARAEALLARAGGETGALAVIALDLDHFKAVNDTHGHAVGDQALRHVAALLRAGRREGDLLARMGGEEFVLLAPGLGDSEALELAEALRARVAGTPLAVETPTGAPTGQRLSLTASLGVASARTEDMATLDHLLHRADLALYEAKARGRDRVETAVG